MPRPSAMPPAAITGTPTASATCGTSAKVPTCASTRSSRNMPRWPPASAPWAMIASQPCPSSQTASSTVVAEAMTFAPVARTRARSPGSGSPKWKLTTSGRNSSTRVQKASSKGARWPAGVGISGSRPSSR